AQQPSGSTKRVSVLDKERSDAGQGASRATLSPGGVISAHKAEIINPSLTAKPKNPRPQAGGFLVCGHGVGESVPCYQSLLPPSIYESLNRPVSPSSKLRTTVTPSRLCAHRPSPFARRTGLLHNSSGFLASCGSMLT